MLTTTRSVQIEWGDCDPSGLVFHPRYFAMFDWSLSVHFERVGLLKQDFEARFGISGFPAVESHARYLRPLHYGDRVDIETMIAAFGRSSFEARHVIKKDGDVMVEGSSKRVWAGRDPAAPQKLKGRPIPEEVKALFTTGRTG